MSRQAFAGRLVAALVMMGVVGSCDAYRDHVERMSKNVCRLGGESCSLDADCCDGSCFANHCDHREP